MKNEEDGTMAQESHAPLVKQIERAFAAVEYPGDDRLVNPEMLVSLEAQGVVERLRGRRRSSLTLDDLLREAESIFLLTPEAFRYYLPAFLTAVVEHFEESDQIPDTTIFALTPKEGPDVSEAAASRLLALDGPQRLAIAAFLRFMLERVEPSEKDVPGGEEATLRKLIPYYAKTAEQVESKAAESKTAPEVP